MALGGPGARPGTGMPGAPVCRPGSRRRGRRRPPQTARTARSRRSATRRPHPASPVRSRRAALPRRGLHTGASCFAGRGRRTRAGTARVVPPRQWVGSAGVAPIQRVGGEADEHLAGEGVVPRVQQRKLAHQLQDVSVAGEPVKQDPAGGPGVLGGRPLPGRHIPTVGQNHQSPRSLPADARRRPVQRSTPPVTLRCYLMSCVTHVNRRSARPLAHLR